MVLTLEDIGVETNKRYNMIDLGLPSGLLWADRNIGATSPEEAGLYFQWGDTQGYTAEQVGVGEEQKAFTWTDYKFSIDGSSSNFSKYNASDGKTVLDLEDDAAHVNMGENWRMPTFEDMRELLLNTDIYLVTTTGEEILCTVTEKDKKIWIINNSLQTEIILKGVKFCKKDDKQTYMFVPTSGIARDGKVQDINLFGYISSSERYHDGTQIVWAFYFYGMNDGGVYFKHRFYGTPVHGVCE